MPKARELSPRTIERRAKAQAVRDRRRAADEERKLFREAAEVLRPVYGYEQTLLAELVVRFAASGDGAALRILAAREHLAAAGVDRLEIADDDILAAVVAVHTSGTRPLAA